MRRVCAAAGRRAGADTGLPGAGPRARSERAVPGRERGAAGQRRASARARAHGRLGARRRDRGASHFDPKPTLDAAKHNLLACYDKARQANPGLRGKLKLVITVNEAGAVTRVDGETGAPAYDPTLIACIGEALKAAHFPKPPGLATVTAPLVFRP